jgi:phosphoribosylformimino-5-aminoimidazole carboxamide ribonucleotide (ProFAR) isomerase
LQNSAIQLGKLYFSAPFLQECKDILHQGELTKRKKPSPDAKETSAEPSGHGTNELHTNGLKNTKFRFNEHNKNIIKIHRDSLQLAVQEFADAG